MYDALEEQLSEELKSRIEQSDRSLLAAYLQSLLAYPNRCFRAEVVEDSNGEFVASAPALIDPIYTMMQASRRTWRIGQVNDVDVHFVVYRDTMEHRATSLVGQKLAAAQLLYGDNVEGIADRAIRFRTWFPRRPRAQRN